MVYTCAHIHSQPYNLEPFPSVSPSSYAVPAGEVLLRRDWLTPASGWSPGTLHSSLETPPDRMSRPGGGLLEARCCGKHWAVRMNNAGVLCASHSWWENPGVLWGFLALASFMGVLRISWLTQMGLNSIKCKGKWMTADGSGGGKPCLWIILNAHINVRVVLYLLYRWGKPRSDG